MAVDGDEKPKFRCLDAGRYVVAFMVAVILVVIIVHAVVTVLRPGNLILRIEGGYVSVSKISLDKLYLRFTLRAFNPSGRVRIYFTNILANISRSSTVEDFLVFKFRVDELAVGQQDAAEVFASVTASSKSMLPDAFNQLFRGSSISNAILKLSGNRIVETYEGHNDTASKHVVYYCPSITVGGEEPEDAPPYVRCTEQLPAIGTT